MRSQLEVAASLVPEHQRRRVLGHLRSDSEDQAAGGAAVLLLAHTLHHLGWLVEHEPEIDGGTPDLRIKRACADFVVEVRQVIGWTRVPNRRDFERVEKALEGL